ncbi:MAG: YciI family protein [Dehalococcoidia bacterium]|nr:YciI family protein [Dehalococcoidia bacterium]
MHILFYNYVEDVAPKREPFRAQHLDLLRDLERKGIVKMAGAFADPLDGAVIIFNTDDRSVVEAFVQEDPYVANGLVTTWRIRAWDVVIGAEG